LDFISCLQLCLTVRDTGDSQLSPINVLLEYFERCMKCVVNLTYRANESGNKKVPKEIVIIK